MIIEARGNASLRCDGCGKRHSQVMEIKNKRWLAVRARADGWRCYFGWPAPISPDWPNGKRQWRHACPACVAAFAERQSSGDGRLF